jgi:hypothetical protein
MGAPITCSSKGDTCSETHGSTHFQCTCR